MDVASKLTNPLVVRVEQSGRGMQEHEGVLRQFATSPDCFTREIEYLFRKGYYYCIEISNSIFFLLLDHG